MLNIVLILLLALAYSVWQLTGNESYVHLSVSGI